MREREAKSVFPKGVHMTPIPSPLLGPLLAEIHDIGELKCTLRAVSLIHQATKKPRYISEHQLLSDEVLLNSLGSIEAISEGVTAAVKRGTLARVEHTPFEAGLIVLNTHDGRVAIQRTVDKDHEFSGPITTQTRRNIFELYENNVGALSPMIVDELKQAEIDYPDAWIEDAFREAVIANARSWRYVRSILDRWRAEGRGTSRGSQKSRGNSGGSRGHIKEARPGASSRY